MRQWLSRLPGFLPPLLVFLAALGLWEAIVRVAAIPPYILPAPSLIIATLYNDCAILFPALWITVEITFGAFLAATLGGVLLALCFARWPWAERCFLPFAIILQVTPIVAIAPLLVIYLDAGSAVLTCAFLVAFFPILANTSLGLAATDRMLVDLFTFYGASRAQMLWWLRWPSGLPYFLGGLRIGGGLALIGAIVAELAAGAAGKGAGLAFRITEAGYRLNIPRMFAGLTLISLTGITIFFLLSAVSRLLLRHWHESARSSER